MVFGQMICAAAGPQHLVPDGYGRLVSTVRKFAGGWAMAGCGWWAFGVGLPPRGVSRMVLRMVAGWFAGVAFPGKLLERLVLRRVTDGYG
jgi:hypothetical protein